MINQDYLFCEDWSNVEAQQLPEKAIYLYEQGAEDRSVYCISHLQASNTGCVFASVKELPGDEIEIEIENSATGKSIISLYSPASILAFIQKFAPRVVFLDVTGMCCRVVAPMMKVLLDNNVDLRVVYVEPRDYIVEKFQQEGMNKDLSESIDGVDPLPGFTSFMPMGDDALFVALLGFEGGRFSYLLSEQQPTDDRIRPVLGVPGYKMNYPYEALWGNRNAIESTHCWNYLCYAEANSIVDVYFKLEALYKLNHRPQMIIAPIGTKPHVIGAILYAIKNPDRVELLYDNPKRTLHRTNGIGRVICCDVTRLYNA